MFTNSSSTVSGTPRARIATTMPVVSDISTGVRVRALTEPNTGGSSRSRDIT